MEQEMLAAARAEADAELAGGSGTAIVVTASNSWHPGIVGLLASRAEGSCAPASLRHCLQCCGHRYPFGPFGVGLRPRPAGARGRRCRVDRQGRRPWHGGRHHRRACQARRAQGLFRGAGRRPTCFGCRMRKAWRSTGRLPRKARRLGCSTRWRRLGLSAPAMWRLSSCCRAIDCRRPSGWERPYSRRTAVGQRWPHPGDRVSRRRYRAWRIPVQEPGQGPSMSPARCPAITGTATARCSFASSMRQRRESYPDLIRREPTGTGSVH